MVKISIEIYDFTCTSHYVHPLLEIVQSNLSILKMDQVNPRPRGRGHHKQRKKGAWSLFYRPKNAELHRQLASKRNTGVNTSTLTTASRIKESLAHISLPEHWEVFVGYDNLQYNKLQISSDGLREVTSSLLISNDLSWSIHIHGIHMWSFQWFSSNAVFPGCWNKPALAFTPSSNLPR